MKYIHLILFLVAGLTTFSQSTQKFTVHFDYNKFDITPSSKEILDSFLHSSLPGSVIGINLYGHCDSVGNYEYNDKLSLNRILAVQKYLVSNHLDALLIKEEKGFGKRQPLNNNSTVDERYVNRRVEIIVQKKEEVVETKKEEKPIELDKRLTATTSSSHQSLEEHIRDSATKTGTKIILQNMNFIGGRHVLLPQSVPVLKELLQVLVDNPTLEIEIEGHICCTFGAEDGIDMETRTPNLSVNRAMAVYEYLVGHGIKKKRLSYRGFGHSMPLVYPEDSEDKRTTNRRVEIKIIRK